MKFKFLLVFLIMLNLKNTLLANETVNLYDFSFEDIDGNQVNLEKFCLLYTSPSPRDVVPSRMPSSA